MTSRKIEQGDSKVKDGMSKDHIFILKNRPPFLS